jgi:hypothetical protein
MQLLLVLLALYLLVALFVLPIWTMIRFGALKRMQEELTRELASLARDVRKLRATQRLVFSRLSRDRGAHLAVLLVCIPGQLVRVCAGLV